jgi:polysaccharide pyruvyl transferase WcaK-like protein
MAPSRWFVEGLGPALEARCPVVWHGVGVPWAPGEEEARRLRAALAGRPYITVRDRFSARRLTDAGVERPVDVVPDSALLVDRILPVAALRDRLGALRDRGGYPGPSSPVLAVQGCDLMVPHVAAVAEGVSHWRAARPDGEVVVIETGRCRGDGAFADALQLVLGPGLRVRRLPTGVTVEDLAAAIVGADLFLGSSLHGAITALAYGRAFVLLNLMGEAKLDGFGDLTGLGRHVLHSAAEIPGGLDASLAAGPAPPALLAGLQHQIDRHFDRLAHMAGTRAAATPRRPPRGLPARLLQRFARR